VRGQRRLFREQEAYVFNGLYQQRFVQRPILTREEIRFRIAVLSVAVPVAFGLAFGVPFLIRTALLARGGVR
jgi:cation transport ATPase